MNGRPLGGRFPRVGVFILSAILAHFMVVKCALTPLFGCVDPFRSTGPYGGEGPSAATQGPSLHPVGSIIASVRLY
jgi:hypothetical protein